MESNTLVLNLSNIISKDVVLLRLAVALLRYLMQILKKSSYIPIEPKVTHDLYFLINLVLITEFEVELPDNLDDDNIGELEAFSSEY